MVVGTRQLGLAILMHEAAHGGLHSNKAINEWVGQWLCAVPVGADLASYRSYHLQHHKFTQQPEDPDLSLSAPFPITKESYTRKAIRDLTGQTFVKQRLPLFLSLFRRSDGRRPRSRMIVSSPAAPTRWRASSRSTPLLFALFWLAGAGIWYWAVWVIGMATWLPLVTRIRNIAEHACTVDRRRSVQPRPHHAGGPARAAADRALLGELSRRTSSVHVSAVLPAAGSASAPAEKGLIKRMKSSGLSRRDAAGDVTRAGLRRLRRHQRLNRNGPRRPAAVPSRIPVTARNDASASVDTPVRPCPTEQPSAIAPPDPISAAPLIERSMWRGEV